MHPYRSYQILYSHSQKLPRPSIDWQSKIALQPLQELKKIAKENIFLRKTFVIPLFCNFGRGDRKLEIVKDQIGI